MRRARMIACDMRNGRAPRLRGLEGAVKGGLAAVLGGIAVIYLGLCLYLYVIQRSLMYFPTPPTRRAPAEELSVAADGATLRVWRLNGRQTAAILYFGGNAEDVAGNVDDFAAWFPDASVYLVNYRGYGGSTGTPTEQGLYRDAEAVFDLTHQLHPRVWVIGRSLGAGVATYLASVRDVDRLVLVSPAASFTALAQELYPGVPTGWLLKDRFDSMGRADRIRAPVLVLIASDDRTIAPEHSQRLVAAMNRTRVEVRVIEQTDHNSIGQSPLYSLALQGFLTGR